MVWRCFSLSNLFDFFMSLPPISICLSYVLCAQHLNGENVSPAKFDKVNYKVDCWYVNILTYVHISGNNVLRQTDVKKVNEHNGAERERKKEREYIARSCFYDTKFHLPCTLFISWNMIPLSCGFKRGRTFKKKINTNTVVNIKKHVRFKCTGESYCVHFVLSGITSQVGKC